MKKQLIALIMVLILIIIGFNGCLEEKNLNQKNTKSQISKEVILTTNKKEYMYGERLTLLNLTILNNKKSSIFNQGGKIPTPSPIKSFEYGLETFVNESWNEFQLVRGKTWEHLDDSTIQVVLECVEYHPNNTYFEIIYLTYYVIDDNGNHFENIPPGKYRIVKSFYNGCNEDFLTNWSEPFTVYSNEFTIVENIVNISSIEYLVNHSEEFINKTICVTGTVDHGPGVFLAYMCPPDDPCCQSSSADLLLYGETGKIKISNGYCFGDNCGNWECSPLELNKKYKVIGNWTNDGLKLISFEQIHS